MNDWTELRQAVVGAGKRLLAEGLVARTWGNVSVRAGAEHMLITPSGRAYEGMTPEDIVPVNLRTGAYEGPLKPSSEGKLHAEIYRTRPEIQAVIHTHQMNASTVAAARREVPPILDDMVQIIGPTVRVADYALPSTNKIVRVTVKALRGRMAALMANHGAVCLGRNLDEAFVVCQVLEKACKAFIEAEFLGGAKSINRIEAFLMHQVYLRKYSALKDENPGKGA
jgi:L-fuculose-phosphate aldolase